MEAVFLIPIVAIVGGLCVGVYSMHHEERMARLKAETQGLGGEEAASYAGAVDRLEARMNALEAILDDEVPGWRRKYDD